MRVDAAAAEEAMRLHASCPPEEERAETWVAAVEDDGSEAVTGSQSATPTPTPPPDGQQMIKRVDGGQRARVEMLSPVSVEEKGEEKEREAPVLRRSYAGSSPSTSYEFSNVRVSDSDAMGVSWETCADECVDVVEAVFAVVVFAVGQPVSRHATFGETGL